MNDTREKKFSELNQTLREWLGSEKSTEYLDSVQKHFSFTNEQRLEVARLSLDRCLNLISQEELPAQIAEKLKIPPTWAAPVANELEDGLIKAFRELEHVPAEQKKPDGPVLKSVTAPQATPEWTHIAKPVVPETHKPEEIDEQPFYPRVPNYSKPMTNPAPRAPQTPRAHDPYHEAIE